MNAARARVSRHRGQWAERVAKTYLTARGLKPLCENYSFKGGEIDLIMRDGETIVFIEVRYRKSSGFGNGAESVTSAKQRRVVATAQHYLQHTPELSDQPCRFDVIAISNDIQRYEVEWIPGAFDA